MLLETCSLNPDCLDYNNPFTFKEKKWFCIYLPLKFTDLNTQPVINLCVHTYICICKPKYT